MASRTKYRKRCLCGYEKVVTNCTYRKCPICGSNDWDFKEIREGQDTDYYVCYFGKTKEGFRKVMICFPKKKRFEVRVLDEDGSVRNKTIYDTRTKAEKAIIRL